MRGQACYDVREETVMIELTEELRQAFHHGEKPHRLLDATTNTIYVLLPVEVYERLRELVADEDDPRAAYPAPDRAFAEGWSDPKMDDYDRYEELHP